MQSSQSTRHGNSEVASGADPRVTPGKVREFKRGNINFDFLQPDAGSVHDTNSLPDVERRSNQRDGKRGLFNRGRETRPIGFWHYAGYILLLGVSLGGIGLAIWSKQTILLLLLLPLLGLCAAGSLLMLILFKIRPG